MNIYNAETPEELQEQLTGRYSKNPRLLEYKEREFKAAIEQYVKQKAEIYGLCTNISVVIHDNGSVEHVYGFTEEQKTILKLIDDLIASKRREIF